MSVTLIMWELSQECLFIVDSENIKIYAVYRKIKIE